MQNKVDDNQQEWVVIAKFGRPHGIKGFISVYSFTEPPVNIMQYMPWHVYHLKQWQPLTLLAIEEKKNHFIVQLEGYNDRGQVASLTNANIGVERALLPDLQEGEYYWHDLIGLNVFTQQGIELGVVTDLLSSGSNDILVIEGERQHLIPYSPTQYIVHIDLKMNKMIVDWDLSL